MFQRNLPSSALEVVSFALVQVKKINTLFNILRETTMFISLFQRLKYDCTIRDYSVCIIKTMAPDQFSLKRAELFRIHLSIVHYFRSLTGDLQSLVHDADIHM